MNVGERFHDGEGDYSDFRVNEDGTMPMEPASAPNAAEMYELAALQCVGPLTPQQTARLEELVLENGDLRHRYIVYMQLHAQVEQAWRATHEEATGARLAAAVPSDARADRALPVDETAAVPLVLQPFGFFHSSLGGMVLAYTMAVVLLGVGILAALAWRVPGGAPAVGVRVPPARDPMEFRLPDAPPGAIRVLTVAMNCRWANPQTAEEDVRHGKFELASGILEITYADTGAKVLLAGPVTYFVDSAHSGALAHGKMVFHLAYKPTPQEVWARPLFRVRTPTVIVTDHGGAEFGIEVDKTPQSHVAVFRGVADVQLAGRHVARALRQDDSVSVKRLANHGLEVRLYTGKPDMNETFARRLPKFPPLAIDQRKQTAPLEITAPRHFPDS
jgi:hypothetical protein